MCTSDKPKWFSSLFLLTAASLCAVPQDPYVIAGEASFNQLSTDVYQIDAHDRSIIEWKSFGIRAEEMVRFVLPSSHAAILNRVIGREISELMGVLKSNGHVYLINPRGIVIGKEGVVKTASFLASTLDVSNDQFLQQREMRFIKTADGVLINHGTIQTEAGDVTLLSPVLKNEGTIQASGGDVYLASGMEILLKPERAPLINIRLSSDGPLVLENTGSIRLSDNFYAAGVQHERAPDALQIKNTGRQIVLTAQGSVDNKGVLEVPQGKISLSSFEKGVIQGGELNASGGTIQITAPVYLNSGSLKANSIQIKVEKNYIETASASNQAPEGSITIQAPKIFTSATHQAETISLLGEQIRLPAASLQSSPQGKIYLGIDSYQTVYSQEIYHNDDTQIQTGQLLLGSTITLSSQFEFVDPNQGGGTGFGTQVVALPAGTVVITKPGDNLFASNSGAAYLYNAGTAALISTLTGSSANDMVSSGGVTTLSNGNYVISSPNWSNQGALVAGAATWGSGTAGVSGTVSATNSLVGTFTNDSIGSLKIVTLTGNSNYVVVSPNWTNVTAGAPAAGAVTWANGATGIVGTVSVSNSLVGTTLDDHVGTGGAAVLPNGNYVVISPDWANGAAAIAGAATWGNGATGIVGTVSISNSLVGTAANSTVSSAGVRVLTNSNYVVMSPNWTNGITPNLGAVTWGNGSSGTVGAVSAANSIVGAAPGDHVGNGVIVALTSGNYAFTSPSWANGANTLAGAATQGNGNGGTVGVLSAANSLVGTAPSDQVGSSGITALTNGNYVVKSPNWANGGAGTAGAATWGNGSGGTNGTVSVDNSLVGTTPNDQVSSAGVTALTNGNYVVRSPHWTNGVAANAGAATWGNGSGGTVGTVSVSNSLVGTMGSDQVSVTGVTALTNGNYVVASPQWHNAAVASAGAATWGNGASGVVGTVSISNSLVGTTPNDTVSSAGIVALPSGNYVVLSPVWNDGAVSQAGAVTWGNGSAGITGVVSASNSLIGTTLDDDIGNDGITVLSNGNYVVISPNWTNAGTHSTGAATWASGATGISGTVSVSNSLVGTAVLDDVSNQGVIALSNGNYVVLSPLWNNGAVVNGGAATFGNGATGIVGTVSISNSLVGTTTNDLVGSDGVLDFGSIYVVISSAWNNGGFSAAGAVTIGNPSSGISGPVTTSNSIVGLNSATGLTPGTVVFSSAKHTVIAGFPTESGSGRVRGLGIITIITPAPPFVPSAKTLARGLNSFQRAIGDVYDMLRTSIYGGVLDQIPYTAFKRYVEPDYLANLIEWPFETQSYLENKTRENHL